MSNITDIDLHTYADGQLDEARRLLVEAHLAHDAQAAENVRVWREQNEALRALYNPVLNEPVPRRLLAARAPRGRWGLPSGWAGWCMPTASTDRQRQRPCRAGPQSHTPCMRLKYGTRWKSALISRTTW